MLNQQPCLRLSPPLSQDYILLEMNFPSDYPFAPPFIRVVEPRFAFHSGHVT